MKLKTFVFVWGASPPPPHFFFYPCPFWMSHQEYLSIVNETCSIVSVGRTLFMFLTLSAPGVSVGGHNIFDIMVRDGGGGGAFVSISFNGITKCLQVLKAAMCSH